MLSEFLNDIMPHRYNRWFDVGKFKVVWVNYAIMCSISWNLDLKFPQPFRTLEDIFSFLELSLLRLMPMGCLAPFDFISDFCAFARARFAILRLSLLSPQTFSWPPRSCY